MPKPTKVKGKKLKYLTTSEREYRSMQDLEMWLNQLFHNMDSAVKEKDTTKAFAASQNIVIVMREMEKLKDRKEAQTIKFKMRNILTHATSGNMDVEEALEKLKEWV